MSNQLNTNELADVFQGRTQKLLQAVNADREKEVAKKSSAKPSSSSNLGNKSYITQKQSAMTSTTSKLQAPNSAHLVDGPGQITSSTNVVLQEGNKGMLASTDNNMQRSQTKRKETGNNTDSEDTNTNTRLDTTRSPRSKDGGFNSHNLINAKLESIQAHGGGSALNLNTQEHIRGVV